MNITRQEVEDFWRKTIGNDAKDKSAKKWIDATYAKIREWDMPLNMIVIERHSCYWLSPRMNGRPWNPRINQGLGKPVVHRTREEQLSIVVGYHARSRSNGWNARGKWFMFPKMTPKQWFNRKDD